MASIDILKLITDKRVRFNSLAKNGFYKKMDDERFLRLAWKVKMGGPLNIDNPQTFNEKLQWLKLNDRKPIYSTMVDKYDAKDYVASIIGDKYIIPTYGIWESFDDIDFEALPEKFVLKCTHNSGGVCIVKDKSSFDTSNAKRKIEKCLNRNFYWYGREWPYKNVKPRIIAEEYLDGCGTETINDYKLMCFNGEVKCSFVCSNRNSKSGLNVTFFDREWKRLPFERHYPADLHEISEPQNYQKMIQLAEKLSTGITFLRVDFYEVNNKIFFGELTFFPGGGFEEFTPVSWDYKLGEWMRL